ncbi:MAG: heat-inducible transcriptional repressor HrcA [Rhodobacteraceae bacterium]|nr:heat-inducible transcriptional repressor HrcA [Paracoccaceae bacterium]MCY4250746.1 heat-inducible transcriptional repressor HrcA [Paracoccaceae bacterium]MCY4307384.1 heat-inducible transcriptional repressor HrcA [Paracoccaceae bacterium]
MSKEEILEILDQRNTEIFSRLVESYLYSGSPVGSRAISRNLSTKISPATVRNVMQDLERLGLLESPHVSAGRIPTLIGLRLFVDEFLEIGEIEPEDKKQFSRIGSTEDDNLNNSLDRIGSLLSRLTQSASLVLMPKKESTIKHVQFLKLTNESALVVLVMADGTVENRVFSTPMGLTASTLTEAANYVNSLLDGKSIIEIKGLISKDILKQKSKLDELTTELVERGLAFWDKPGEQQERLIVRGRSNLLENDEGTVDFDQVRHLFDDLERKKEISNILELIEEGQGVKIFIGSENKLFSLSGSTLVAAPYINSEGNIVGALGVIGPTRLNYGRIVPIVDYTAQLVGKLIAEKS